MGKTIKGITVEINGDASGLGKVLKTVDSYANSLGKNLKSVNAALKLDPSNTELLAQKQRLLGEAVENTKTRLDALKQAQEEAAKTVGNYDAWKETYTPIGESIDTTKKKLAELIAKQKEMLEIELDNTDEYEQLAASIVDTQNTLKDLKAQAKAVAEEFGNPISTEEYEKLQREIVFTANELKSLEEQQKNFGSVVQQEMEVALQKVGEFGDKITTVGDGISSAGDKISGVGDKLLPVTAAIVGAGTAVVSLGSDLEESQNKVSVAFSNSADQVYAFAQNTLESYGIAEGTALDMAALFGDMATSMKLPQDAAANMSTSLVGLAGDLASFKNISLDEASSALKGIFTGETESLKNLGVVMTQDNLLAYAMAQGFLDTAKSAQELEKQQIAVEKAQVSYNDVLKKYGEGSLEAREAALELSDAEAKLAEDGKASLDALSEAEMVQLRYAYVLEQTANAHGDFANTSDGAANSMRTAQEAIKECGASFGTMLTPYVAEIAQYLTQLIKGFTQLPEEQKKTILTIAAVVAAIGPLLTVFGKTVSGVGSVVSGVGTLTKAFSSAGGMAKIMATASQGLGTVMSFLAANPIVLVIAAIAALVAGLVAAYNNCEWFRDGVNACIEEVKEIWTSCVEGVKGVLAGLRETWSNVTETIKNVTDAGMSAVKSTMESRLASIKSAYEANGGGLKGIAAATMSAIEGYYTDGWRVIDQLTGGRLSTLANTISSKMDAARETVRAAIDKIKGLFNFSWSLPSIKLPHFSISGSFSLRPPSVPRFSVSWYKDGGILQSPTIFGALGGKLLGGGEAGKEAVLPLSGFYKELESILSRIRGGGTNMIVNLNIDHFENTCEQDVDDLADTVAERIHFKLQQKEAALT